MENELIISYMKEYLMSLQAQLIDALEGLDTAQRFTSETVNNPNGGISLPKILYDGKNIEKAAVNYTHSVGSNLPRSASLSNDQLAGRPFQAASLSLIVHPRNPFVPTTHFNLRLFVVMTDPISWHFGGGYDLTPCYGFKEDAIAWHRGAREASGKHYGEMKEQCDRYFFLPHRDEQRGIGGIFFDDYRDEDFQTSFKRIKKIGDSFLPLYRSIFLRRKDTPYSEANKKFQIFRRGRYAEFNLVVDRGTKYGLESGRRIESVLSSMPPLASWIYNYPIDEGSSEWDLYDYYLKPRNWLSE